MTRRPRQVGVSNVSPGQFETARRITTISSMQNEFNVFQRHDELNGLLRSCESLGVAYLAYSPLGGSERAIRLGDLAPIAGTARRLAVSPQRVVWRGSIIGAGAVVFQDVPPNSYVKGNPARVMNQLPERVIDSSAWRKSAREPGGANTANE